MGRDGFVRWLEALDLSGFEAIFQTLTMACDRGLE